jgi:maltooligosyltrehalose trehalohydrolase
MSQNQNRNLWTLDLGANFLSASRIGFRVWAPRVSRMDLKVFQNAASLPEGRVRLLPMQKDAKGYFYAETIHENHGALRYQYILDGEKERPDPASRFQPEGVHGPSQVINPESFKWTDKNWKGIPIQDFVIYEAHIGTFTPKGTFEAAIEKISYLKKLGVTCLEIMPIAQFPGERNWGYDGVNSYAVQNSYGGPDGLKALINECHRQKMAVCLDVVYNHFGPEGNYLNDFGPYFTSHYQTPWGDALNYDGPESDSVRRFIISNALYWVTEFHVDALRLDAIHGIFDFSAKHILQELSEKVKEQSKKLGRHVSVIAESDLNDSRIIRPVEKGGYGMDAQWSDDFHHSVHVALTGEKKGYYEDFSGVRDVAKSLSDVFVYDGKYSSHRKRRHGNSARDLPGEKFVISIQNHDQVGNRAAGDRISSLISFESQKLAASLLILAPYIPMIWMGQEYGEPAPFQYFIDHGDAELIEAVRQGRKKEFGTFGWESIPDPKSEATFNASKMNWAKLKVAQHKQQLDLYSDLLLLRKKLGILHKWNRKDMRVALDENEDWIAIQYGHETGIFFSFSEQPLEFASPFPLAHSGRAAKKSGKKVKLILHTDDKKYGGSLKGRGLSKIGFNSRGAAVILFGE